MPESGMSRAEHPETYRSVHALRYIAAPLVTVFNAGLRFDAAQTTFRIGNAGDDNLLWHKRFGIWTVTARRPVSPPTFPKHRFVPLVPLAGAVGLESARRLRVPAWISLLGAASYSLFLTHTFAISLLGKVWPAALSVRAFIPVAAMLAVLIGVLTYLLLENPLLALMRGKSRVLVARLAPS